MRENGVAYTGDIEGDGQLRRIYVEGDKKGTRNGWYKYFDDEHPVGVFGSMRGTDKVTWTAKGTRPLTADERAALHKRTADRKAATAAAEAALWEETAVLAAAMWDDAKPATEHAYLSRKGVPSHGLRVGTYVRQLLPGENGEKRERKYPGTLLIPLRDAKKRVWSLQAIFPKPVSWGKDGETRDKAFPYGGKKLGLWFTIGAPTLFDGVATFILVEGYATGASVHAATGLPVLVCLDAGNLIHVARELRRLKPEARIVFAADNDHWTTRQNGEPWNPGVEKATAAAQAVGGEVIIPHFDDVSSKPTDFNDLHALQGLAAVEGQILGALRPSAPGDEPPPHDEAPDYTNPDDVHYGPPQAPDDSDSGVLTDGFFRVLGHDRDSIYVYQFEKRMITRRGESDWSEASLTAIAPLHWWEREFPGEKGFSKKQAVNWLQREAFRKGFFDPTCRRGRGAWTDDGRSVFHFGNQLLVNGVRMEVTAIDSTYVYEQARRLRQPHDEALSSAEGKMIVETAQVFHWARPASAILLAGWCALAPLCGAFRWRPHIWITGGAGSGKSTILKDFAMWLMNGSAIFAQGNSTEAGIRQTLRMDALPVLFDESEQNNEREEQRVQSIIALIRQSSTESEAKTLKGTQGGESMEFIIRSMFCLSSIQVGMKHQADFERLTILNLRPKRDSEDAGAAWAKISAGLDRLRTDPELPAKLLRRSIALLPTTIINIEVFAKAAAKKFGSQREGDQYGAMLAGAWSLVSTKVATLEQAAAMIDRYDWSEYLENSETEESVKALGALLGKLIRIGKGLEYSVYEVIAAAANRHTETCQLETREADGILRRHGMMVYWNGKHAADADLLVSNTSQELARLMEGTPYAADLKGQLLRVPGAYRHGSERFNGTVSRCVGIPLREILAGLKDSRSQPAAFDIDDELPF